MSAPDTITVIPRVHGRKRSPVLFMPELPAGPHLVACYEPGRGSGRVHLDYYRHETQAPRAGECEALLRDYTLTLHAGTSIRLARRLTNKLYFSRVA